MSNKTTARKFFAPSNQACKIQNPNIERSPADRNKQEAKQIQNCRKFKTPNPPNDGSAPSCLADPNRVCLEFWSFEFVSDFEFRILGLSLRPLRFLRLILRVRVLHYVTFVLRSMIISAACANVSGVEDPRIRICLAQRRQGRQVRKYIFFSLRPLRLCVRYSETDRCAKRTLRKPSCPSCLRGESDFSRCGCALPR